MNTAYADFVANTRASHGEEADRWLADVEVLIAELCGRWELETNQPYEGGDVGYVVQAIRSRQDPVVLKISYPDGWFEQQTAALLHWDGNGVAELIDHDERGAQLLEQCIPGTSLLDEPDEDAALEQAALVLEQLWSPDPGGIASVSDEVAAWVATMADRNEAAGGPIDSDLIEEVRELLIARSGDQREQLLLHGDLHMGNMLAAKRRPWLAIDPKPLVGEREFDVTALVRDKQEELVADVDAGQIRVQHRFDVLSERLGCDRQRLKDWSAGIMVDYALWCFEVDARDYGVRQVAVARMMQALKV